jgi:quercetin dioxygenase-like cupin family protein
MKIGQKIKELRKERAMTLQELSQESGVALATLSRIENDRMTGTIDSHLQICKALNVNLPQLYSEIEEGKKQVAMQPAAGRTEVFVHNKKSSSEMLTLDVLSKRMMPVMVNIEKGGSTHKEEAKPGVEKFIYVLEGKIEATIGKEKFTMKKSDTLYFDATLPHILKNVSAATARIFCITSPPTL